MSSRVLPQPAGQLLIVVVVEIPNSVESTLLPRLGADRQPELMEVDMRV